MRNKSQPINQKVTKRRRGRRKNKRAEAASKKKKKPLNDGREMWKRRARPRHLEMSPRIDIVCKMMSMFGARTFFISFQKKCGLCLNIGRVLFHIWHFTRIHPNDILMNLLVWFRLYAGTFAHLLVLHSIEKRLKPEEVVRWFYDSLECRIPCQ